MISTPDGTPSSRRNARPVTLALVLGGYALCVLVLVLFLVHREQARVPSGPSNLLTTRPGFPSPPAGAVVFSRHVGPNALALALVPGESRMLAQASALGADGAGISELSVTFAVHGLTTTASPCGSGCYRATLATKGPPRSVEVVIQGELSTRWRLGLPTAWPPPDASRMVARAERVWRSLHSLSFTERLASDEQHAVKSTWQLQAPDRLAYHVEHGSEAVIIGNRRWDRTAAGRWRESSQIPVTQPIPPWVSAANARVLGRIVGGGRSAWKVSFFDPQTPGWFTLVLDRRTFRTLELEMITTAHFMHDVFSSFNATPAIEAPR